MIYITSDTHFGHENILKFEPMRIKILGDTIQQHDAELIKRFNSRLRKEDTLIVAGDFGLTNQFKIKDYLEQLNCSNKILVIGNHDRHNAATYYRCGFNCVTYELIINLAKEKVRICHFPYRKPWYRCVFKGMEKDRKKRPTNYGHILLHGHIHSGSGQKEFSKNMINIGVDCNHYYPVPLDKIANTICHIRGK